MRRCLYILLALSCLLLAGCNTAQQPPTDTPTDEAIPIPVEECYTYTEEENGTYSYVVRNWSGEIILEDYYATYPVTFKPIGKNQLAVSSQSGPKLANRWAVVCDVQGNRPYSRIYGAVAVGELQVAYVEQRTGQYFLFVCDSLNPQEIQDSYPLTGLAVLDGEEPDIKVKQKGKTLTLTYPTASGKDSLTVTLK